MSFTSHFLITVDSDRQSYEMCMAIVREKLNAKPDEYPEVVQGVWTRNQAIRFYCADDLQEYFENRLDDPRSRHDKSTRCLISQLLSQALQELNWREMAGHYLAKCREHDRLQKAQSMLCKDAIRHLDKKIKANRK